MRQWYSYPCCILNETCAVEPIVRVCKSWWSNLLTRYSRFALRSCVCVFVTLATPMQNHKWWYIEDGETTSRVSLPCTVHGTW